jgi:hypothetical protein
MKKMKILEKKRRNPTSTGETRLPPNPRSWWPYQRREEFGELRTLLNEISMINNGSSAIERIQRCIALAKKLQGSGVRGRGYGGHFLAFLEDEMFTGERPIEETPSVPSASENHLAARVIP